MQQPATQSTSTTKEADSKPKKLMDLLNEMPSKRGQDMAAKDIGRMLTNLKRQRNEQDIRAGLEIVMDQLDEADTL